MRQRVNEWTEQAQDVFRVIFAPIQDSRTHCVGLVKPPRSPSAPVLFNYYFFFHFVEREVWNHLLLMGYKSN